MLHVYRFEYFHHTTSTYVLADEDYATEDAIREIGGRMLRESSLEVHASRVGRGGYLLPDEL